MFKFQGKAKEGIQPEEPAKDYTETKEEIKVRGVYGMYTTEGNKAVAELTALARAKGNRYQIDNEGQKIARSYLRALATKPGFEEARDKEVEAIVFYKLRRNTK